MNKTILTALLLLVPLYSPAAIYKCQADQGIVYTDYPCGKRMPIDDSGYSNFGATGIRPGEQQLLRESNINKE